MKKSFLFMILITCLLDILVFSASESQKTSLIIHTLVPYVPKNFDYLIGKKTGLNDELLKMHFQLYRGYVAHTNGIRARLQELDAKHEYGGVEYAELKRRLGWEFNGMLLHEYYFENLGRGAKLEKDDPFLIQINEDFGSFDAWKADFIATGLMRGIGWVITYVDPKEGQLVNMWINEHDVGHLSGGSPVLVMDVFEHAYMTQFALDRSKYIDTFFATINWPIVSQRYRVTRDKEWGSDYTQAR